MFEQGPIRPPSEAESLLLRLTRNCPWNKCEFCTTFTGEKFSRRTVEEIKEDINNVSQIVERILEKSSRAKYGGINLQILNDLYATGNHQIIHVASWLYRGGKTVFLQDANSLIMKTADLVEVLCYLKEKLPTVERITSYARSKTLVRKSLHELEELRQAGLNRIHIGMESGSDAVLKFINKGVTAEEHVEAGIKVMASGISLSEYIILGMGGRLWPEEHPLKTAETLNRINPNFIRLRTLAIPENVPLYKKLATGEFPELTEDEIVREERLLIENLNGISSAIASDHILNLLEEVQGRLPDDKPHMLDVIDRYLSMPDIYRKNFRLGRRWGIYRWQDDMGNRANFDRVETALQRLEKEGVLNKTLSSLRAMLLR